MTTKRIQIDFLRRSALSDLTCRDGEVERHSRIAWLDEENADPDSKNPDPAPAASEAVELTACELESTFPPSSRLLAIHNPLGSAAGMEYAIYLQPNGALGCRRLGAGYAALNIGFPPASLGTLRNVCCHGCVATLTGSAGVAWMLYDVAAGSYALLSALPEAPQLTPALDAAHLEGYTRMTGADPELTVAVDLHDLENLPDADTLRGWLEEGHGERVDEAVCRRVYSSVARSVGVYMEDVRDAGMWLTAVNVVAAFGEALPTNATVADGGYAPPYAKLLAWSLHGTTLDLRVAFSLRPMQLTASFSLTALQKSWRGVFPEIGIYLSSETPWIMGEGEPYVTGFTSLGTAAGSGFAFRFRSRSRASLLAYARATRDFRLCSKVDISIANSGVITLKPASGKGAAYTPDYTDFLPVSPDGAVSTDEGVVIWEGNTLLTPMRENGVVYRYRNVVSDFPIHAVVQGGGSKGVTAAGRHPLLVFSGDGIRRVTADGAGGYLNVRLLDRRTLLAASDAASPNPYMAEAAEGALFIASAGLHSVNASGKVSFLSAVPDSFRGDGALKGMVYDSVFGIVLLRGADGECAAYDTAQKKWYAEVTGTVGATLPIVYCSQCLYISSSAHLARFELRLVTSGGETDVSDEKRVAPAPNGKCTLLTRPLKFGSPFQRKRICGISAAVEAAIMIEGSEDLRNWHTLAQCTATCRGLHLPAFRFHRLTLVADEELADHLHRLTLTLKS